MCINLKSFNESFREWNQKGEEGRFVGLPMWWLNQGEENDEPLVPFEIVPSAPIGTDFHDQRPNPQVHFDFDGNLVGVIRNPDAD